MRFQGSYGRFAIAVIAVFLPLTLLADVAPGLALLMAGAVALMFAFSWETTIAKLLGTGGHGGSGK